MLTFGTMRFEDLKAIVQPTLEQDVEALFDEFRQETGTSDLVRFLEHLCALGLVSPDVAEAVRAAQSEVQTQPSGAEQPTVASPQESASADEGEEAESAQSAVGEQAPADSADIEKALAAPPPTASLEANLAAPTQSGEFAAESGEHEVDDKRRAQKFRRTTGGNLRAATSESAPGIRAARRRKRRDGTRTSRKRRSPTPPANANPSYDFLGTVGEGAMGRVYLARDTKLRRRVAYKEMSEEIATQQTLATKFINEAEITAQLEHPNIVPVYALEASNAYAMKLVKGHTVEKIIEETKVQAQSGSIDDEHSLEHQLDLFVKACDALGYAHSRGVIHRDLKPENIMVGAFNELYIMDWGIAKVFTRDVSEPIDLSRDPEDEGDLIIGTPGYMSPEQAEGENEELDAASDQYSLGLILFEMISLNPAVTGKAPLKIVMRHQDGEKNPLRHITGQALPAELVAIVNKATHKDKDERYADVNALADDIKRYLRGDAVQARPDPPLQALLRWMAKHREVTLGLVMLLVTSSFVIIMSVFVYSQLALSAAEAQKQRLSNIQTTVGRQASLIDGQFLKYEGLLSVIATAATDRLVLGASGEEPHYLASTVGTDLGPPDTFESERYQNPISLKSPVFTLPDDSAKAPSLQSDVEHLSTMTSQFKRALLRSYDEKAVNYTPKRAERALADVGVPITWAYIGLENGVFTMFPGRSDDKDDRDHRKKKWYRMAKDAIGPTWGAPTADSSGLGLVLSCSQPMYDDDTFLGVAGVDVTFDYLIENLLEAPDFEDVPNVEAFLLSPEGNVVVRSSKKGAKVDSKSGLQMRMPRFKHESIVRAIEKKRSGGYEITRDTDGEVYVFYNRMHSIGWYYVVTGPRATFEDLGL